MEAMNIPAHMYSRELLNRIPSLSRIKVQLVYRPQVGNSVSHKNLGHGRYELLVHDNEILEGDERISRGALASELSSIALEEKVPRLLRGAYRLAKRISSSFNEVTYRRARELAAKIDSEENIKIFYSWATN